MKLHVVALASCLVTLAIAGPARALPVDGHARGFVEGANHHVGDAGFVAAHRRTFGPGDAEAERMHAHLSHMRATLGARSATRPELAARRAELLGYLDEYIQRGVTPVNTRLPWRTPVFIDERGDICAVGWLIERATGSRALPERIAREHRYDFLEDIAAAMPEVQAWVEASGFTLEELASIQPGYTAPVASRWGFVPFLGDAPDGPHESVAAAQVTRGTVRGHTMDGAWTVAFEGKTVGSGTLRAGAGTWRSYYPDGKRMAEGPLLRGRPEGLWHLYHPSGNVAAEGAFVAGGRAGPWQFFHDRPRRALLAEGSFEGRAIAGIWRHYDAEGRTLAVSREVVPSGWGGTGSLLDVAPGRDGVHRWIHQGNVMGDHVRLDMLSDGSEPIFRTFASGRLYDADGNALVRSAGRWTAADCRWSAARKRAAHASDLVTLHGLMWRSRGDDEENPCGAPKPVAAARAAHLDAVAKHLDAVREPSPAFVRDIALAEVDAEADADWVTERRAEAADLARLLAAHMTWYVEWPHVDGRFVQVFLTLPGYTQGAP